VTKRALTPHFWRAVLGVGKGACFKYVWGKTLLRVTAYFRRIFPYHASIALCFSGKTFPSKEIHFVLKVALGTNGLLLLQLERETWELLNT